MYCRTRTAKQSPSPGRPAEQAKEMVFKQSTITVQITEPESQMETPGVSCWDFAYPTGKCDLAPGKSCFFSRSPKSNHHERSMAHTVAPSCDTLHGEQSRQKNKKQSKKTSGSRTFLLSSPTPISITFPQTKTTISTLLSQPNTKLIYLVPQSYIVCPKVCELMRLPRAAGSSFQVLPVPPEIEMKAGGHDRSSITDVIAVQEVVEKVLKNTKVRSFDGFIAFGDEREAWTFLEHVGRGVKCSAKKG
ncbi:hypothetical protein PV04_01023 [Phialophora macrospora]|uniref:Uncharacterized protein n=1 Tax=Phialophora macrospora TaxID=1851006 RepID=A0A0D2GKF2_9EURO|nr:hypothetical protein PV04_01023 [Phialophora macrospora]